MYRWEGGPALVQTVDFFTPIVDDPYLYGQIAAANALSDVYAMGGRPVTALAIAAFPEGELDRADIAAIFKGGYDKLTEAGAALLGGHTVRDREIKFGYAVTGAVDPAAVLTNSGARVGDLLLLTKPIGTGVVGTAIKSGRAPADLVERAVSSMCRLNRAAAEAIGAAGGVHACTDVTGFGLIGHAMEMAAGSGVSLEIRADSVPIFEGVLPLVARHRSGGMATNRAHFAAHVAGTDGLASDLVDLLYDPQTSGGLLMSVAENRLAALQAALAARGVSNRQIGHVTEARRRATILVV